MIASGRVLDTSAVLALAAGSPYTDALLTVATELAITLAVPAAALQAAWQHADQLSRPWLDLLPALSPIVILPLDADTARSAGLVAATSGHPDAPAGTAHAVHIARARSWVVVTADPHTVLELDSSARTETIP